MPVALLILLSKSLTYIKAKNGFHLNLPGRHIGSFLLFQVWSQLQASIVILQPRTMVAFTSCIIMILLSHRERPYFFHFLYEHAVCLLFGTDVVFPAQYSYVLTSFFIGAFSDLCIGSGARHPVYVFNRDGKLVSIGTIPVIV